MVRDVDVRCGASPFYSGGLLPIYLILVDLVGEIGGGVETSG